MYVHACVSTNYQVQYVCSYVCTVYMYVCQCMVYVRMYVCQYCVVLLADDHVLCKIERLFNQFGKFVLYLCDIAYCNGFPHQWKHQA